MEHFLSKYFIFYKHPNSLHLRTELTVTFHVVNSIDDVMNSIDYRQVSLRLVHSQILIPVPRTRVHGSLRSRSTYIIFNWDGSAISLISVVTSCGASCDSVSFSVCFFIFKTWHFGH